MQVMLSFVQSVTLTILLAFLLRIFVLQPFIVEGSSMEPNFHDREYIVIDKLSYRLRTPHRGEVIVFHPPTNPSENYIKRIIGLPGDTITLSEEDVYVNGHKLDEPYLGENNHTTEALLQKPQTVLGPNDYYVLGDNRTHSSDSREWGPLSIEKIEGRTWLIAFPFKDSRFITAPTYTNLSAWLRHPQAALANLTLGAS